MVTADGCQGAIDTEARCCSQGINVQLVVVVVEEGAASGNVEQLTMSDGQYSETRAISLSDPRWPK
jgi:hypothetical protein